MEKQRRVEKYAFELVFCDCLFCEFPEKSGVKLIGKLDLVIDKLRRRFGNKCVHRAVELTDEVMSGLDIKRDNTVHPVGFLR